MAGASHKILVAFCPPDRPPTLADGRMLGGMQNLAVLYPLKLPTETPDVVLQATVLRGI